MTTKTGFLFRAVPRAHSLTVYWDKPETAGASDRYRLRIGDHVIDGIDRTFAVIDGLDPDTEYSVELSLQRRTRTEPEALAAATFRTAVVKRMIDVTAAPYHAIGDGRTINTDAIQRALDDCGQDEAVLIPAGVFLTGALRMRSHSELVLAEDATLQGSTDPRDYEPRVKARFEGLEMECYASLITVGELDHTVGCTTEDVTIRGKGSILGGGAELMHRVIDSERIRLRDELARLGEAIHEYENANTIPGRVRPRLIDVNNTRGFTLDGLTVGRSSSWNIHMTYCEQVVTCGCTFESVGVWNGDGWDPDSSEDCVLFDCRFHTGDDMVAIKSGKNPEGNAIGRPTSHVRIFGCSSSSGHGVAIGSEMSGGVEDIRIWDCDFAACRYGIHIKGTAKRGGYVRDVTVRDCAIAAITIHAVSYNDDGEGSGSAPMFERYRFERLDVLGRLRTENGSDRPTTAILIRGFDDPEHWVRDVTLRDIRLGAVPDGSGRIELANCRDVRMDGVSAVGVVTTKVD